MFAARTGVIFHSWYTEEYLKQCYFDLTSGCGIVCNVLCTGHGRHRNCTVQDQTNGWVGSGIGLGAARAAALVFVGQVL